MSCCRNCAKCDESECGYVTVAVLCFLIGFVGVIITSFLLHYGKCSQPCFISFVVTFFIGVLGPFWWRVIWKWEDVLQGRKEEL